MSTLTYKNAGDYLLPDITVPQKEYHIGRYGMMRRTYLKHHRPTLYSTLLMSGKLIAHLEEIDRTASEQINRIVAKMIIREGITEQLKVEHPMMWTGLINNIKQSAEEAILQDLIYS